MNPTCYSFKHLTKGDIENNTKKSKFVSKYVVKHEFQHDNYVIAMKTNELLRRNVLSLRSQDNRIRSINNENIAFNSFYYKMQLIDSINYVPFGYIEV